MEFAKNILSKYGWQEGDGLGRDKQGIKKAIKANLKFDSAGLGSNGDTGTSWWERVFNDAASNVKVEKNKNGKVKLDLKDAENSVEISTKSYSIKKLTESGEGVYGNNFLSEKSSVSNFAVKEYKTLTDEQLFEACGGRTAHKGARHGLKLSGKLSRLERQEAELLAKMETKTGEDRAKIFSEVCKERTEKDVKITSKKERKQNNSLVGSLGFGWNYNETQSDGKKDPEEQKSHFVESQNDLESMISKKKKKKRKGSVCENQEYPIESPVEIKKQKNKKRNSPEKSEVYADNSEDNEVPAKKTKKKKNIENDEGVEHILEETETIQKKKKNKNKTKETSEEKPIKYKNEEEIDLPTIESKKKKNKRKTILEECPEVSEKKSKLNKKQ